MSSAQMPMLDAPEAAAAVSEEAAVSGTAVSGTGHVHRQHRGAALEKAARTAMQAAGEQWTQLRADVFAVMTSFATPASAYDIAEKLSRQRGKRIAANSVYRILDLFVATNVAIRVESRNAYMANAHPDCVHDCIFLVCDSCGKTTHMDDDVLSHAMRQRAQGSGFEAQRLIMEVRGRCAACT